MTANAIIVARNLGPAVIFVVARTFHCHSLLLILTWWTRCKPLIYIYIKNVVTFWDFHAPLPKIVKKNEKVDSRWECTCALLKVKISKSHFPSVSSTPTVFEREIRALYPIFQSSFGKILMSAYGAFASMFRQASGHSSSPAMPSLNLKDLSCPRLVGLSGKWMWIVNGTYEHVVCQPMAICGGMSETKIFNIYILCSVT